MALIDVATRDFTHTGVPVTRGEDVSNQWDQRTRDHLRVAGWVATYDDGST